VAYEWPARLTMGIQMSAWHGTAELSLHSPRQDGLAWRSNTVNGGKDVRLHIINLTFSLNKSIVDWRDEPHSFVVAAGSSYVPSR
jgi:hypothetical protein